MAWFWQKEKQPVDALDEAAGPDTPRAPANGSRRVQREADEKTYSSRRNCRSQPG